MYIILYLKELNENFCCEDDDLVTKERERNNLDEGDRVKKINKKQETKIVKRRIFFSVCVVEIDFSLIFC